MHSNPEYATDKKTKSLDIGLNEGNRLKYSQLLIA